MPVVRGFLGGRVHRGGGAAAGSRKK